MSAHKKWSTIAAVKALNKNGFRAAAISAVVAATNTGKEIREGTYNSNFCIIAESTVCRTVTKSFKT